MKIFVTGGSGFLGSHVCQDLLSVGHQVAVLSRNPAPWRLNPVRHLVEIVEGRLEAVDAWRDQLIRFGPDAVAHLAWLGVANHARNDPAQIKNIGWIGDIVAASHAAGARTFVGLGSQAEYGPKAYPIGPGDVTEPTTLYGESKLAAGRIAGALSRSNGMRFVWMRAFSTYGAADHPYWMLPSLIGDLLAGKTPALTAGDQYWDFLHARDAARAIRLAIENVQAHGIYTLGSGQAPPLKHTIELVRDLVDPSKPLGFGQIAYRPDQVMRLQADVARLKQDLDWTAEIDLADGLAETVAWYQTNPWIFDRECAE